MQKIVFFSRDSNFSNGKKKLSYALYSRNCYELDSFINEHSSFIRGFVEFINAIRAELLDGCYFNEIKILNREEKRAKRDETLAMYKKLRDDIYDASYACFEIQEDPAIKK